MGTIILDEFGYDKVSHTYGTKQQIMDNLDKINPYEIVLSTDTDEIYYKDNMNVVRNVTDYSKAMVEDTIDSLKNSGKYRIGDVVEVLGYYTKGDGANHKRVIASIDDGSGVPLTSGVFANIIHSGEVNSSWFGAKGDKITDDTYFVEKACNYDHNIKVVLNNPLIKGVIKLNKSNTIITGSFLASNSCCFFSSFFTQFLELKVRINQDWNSEFLFLADAIHLGNLPLEYVPECGGRRFYFNFYCDNIEIFSNTSWDNSSNWEFTGNLFGMNMSVKNGNLKGTVGQFFNTVKNIKTGCFANSFMKMQFISYDATEEENKSLFLTDCLIDNVKCNNIRNGIILETKNFNNSPNFAPGGYIVVRKFSVQSDDKTERFIDNSTNVTIKLEESAYWDWQKPKGIYYQDPINNTGKGIIEIDKLHDYNNGLKSCKNLSIKNISSDMHVNIYASSRFYGLTSITHKDLCNRMSVGESISFNFSIKPELNIFNIPSSVCFLERVASSLFNVYLYDIDKSFSFCVDPTSQNNVDFIDLCCKQENLIPLTFIKRMFNPTEYFKFMETNFVGSSSISFEIPTSYSNLRQTIDKTLTLDINNTNSPVVKCYITTTTINKNNPYNIYWKKTGSKMEFFIKFSQVENSSYDRLRILSSLRGLKQFKFSNGKVSDTVDPSWTEVIYPEIVF